MNANAKSQKIFSRRESERAARFMQRSAGIIRTKNSLWKEYAKNVVVKNAGQAQKYFSSRNVSRMNKIPTSILKPVAIGVFSIKASVNNPANAKPPPVLTDKNSVSKWRLICNQGRNSPSRTVNQSRRAQDFKIFSEQQRKAYRQSDLRLNHCQTQQHAR